MNWCNKCQKRATDCPCKLIVPPRLDEQEFDVKSLKDECREQDAHHHFQDAIASVASLHGII
jgi:hypothetical protein